MTTRATYTDARIRLYLGSEVVELTSIRDITFDEEPVPEGKPLGEMQIDLAFEYRLVSKSDRSDTVR